MFSNTIKSILIVGAGSFLGGVIRYSISLALKGASKGSLWASLAVNLIGCYLIGLLWGIFSKNGTEDNNWALFLTVGFCGGFTTFSAFSKEALVLLQSGNIYGFIAFLIISVAEGIALVALGYSMVP